VCSGYWFKLCDITAVSEYNYQCVVVIGLNCVILQLLATIIVLCRGYCFKLCNIRAVRECHLYCVGVIGLNSVILHLLANIICTVYELLF